MHPSLAEIVTFLEETRSALLATLDKIPTDRRDVPPHDGAWSASEVLDHLAITESGTARLLAKRVARARETGIGPELQTASRMGSVDGDLIASRAKRRVAPELVRPRPGAKAADALAALTESRVALRAVIADADGLDLGSIKATHLFLGEIDLYQWLLFLAHHERRHTEQLAEIAATATAGTEGAAA